MAHKPVLPPPLSLVELETVGSTNDHAKKLARNGYPAGVVVWAHEQTAGRGRQGNSWESFTGNLYMSMIARPRVNVAQVGQLSLLVGVALANVLSTFVPASADLRLKWPNDIYINGKKIAGILIETESVGAQQLPYAIIGAGVNVTYSPDNAISLHELGLYSYEAGHVLEFLAAEIALLIKKWERDGFADIREAWLKRAYRLGETITARLPQETLSGIFEGLDKGGALLLNVNGKTQVINTAEVFA